MAYVQTEWTAGVTALSETNMDHLETQYDEAVSYCDDAIDTALEDHIQFIYAAAVPDGHYLCDGNNGTQDLDGKVIRCADDPTSSPTGGSDTHVHSQNDGSAAANYVGTSIAAANVSNATMQSTPGSGGAGRFINTGVQSSSTLPAYHKLMAIVRT